MSCCQSAAPRRRLRLAPGAACGDGHAGCRHQIAGADLVTHLLDRRRGRADPGQARVDDLPRRSRRSRPGIRIRGESTWRRSAGRGFEYRRGWRGSSAWPGRGRSHGLVRLGDVRQAPRRPRSRRRWPCLPSRRTVLITRRAISPRFAINTESGTPASLSPRPAPAQPAAASIDVVPWRPGGLEAAYRQAAGDRGQRGDDGGVELALHVGPDPRYGRGDPVPVGEPAT